MEDERDAFYVVRKGDIIGIYKNLSNCLAVTEGNPSIRVFKGYGLPKNAEEYLVSQGLKNAAYSINVVDVQRDLFGKLVPLPFQEVTASTSTVPNSETKHITLDNRIKTEVISPSYNFNPTITLNHTFAQSSWRLEFDGASKGNPGPAGAGAILRAGDGSVVFGLREGVGIATNNVAEYRAVILGMKFALRKGFKHIRVQGDSNLVVMQIQGIWKIRSQNLADLCKEAKELKDKFMSFQIQHIPREYNSQADTLASLAVDLRDGQIEEECIRCPNAV